MTYVVVHYFSDATQRTRFAVYCKASSTFYFPKQYGKRPAQRLAARLNRGAS